MSVTTAARPPRNYLNVSYAVRSWLLTTDHKRIGILYMLSITCFFFLGGAAAADQPDRSGPRLFRHQHLQPQSFLHRGRRPPGGHSWQYDSRRRPAAAAREPAHLACRRRGAAGSEIAILGPPPPRGMTWLAPNHLITSPW